MESYIHLCLNNGNILCSTLPTKLLGEAESCISDCALEMCRVTGKEKRHGKIKNENGYIYLCVYDGSITNKIFKRYFDVLSPLHGTLFKYCEDLKFQEESKTKRLQHNINSYNAKIQDELDSIIPQESINKKNWRETVDAIKDVIQNDTEETAFSLLRILKNIKLINAEMDVYNLLNSGIEKLEMHEHSIHKVIGITLQPFFLDFIENNNNVQIGSCFENVLIDYATISVVLGHIWDNAAKYMGINSILDISFISELDFLIVEISMQSLKVNDEEIENIFSENYSGYWAKQTGINGHGIGMFYAKKLAEMNEGELQFIAGNNVIYSLEGVPYAKNTLKLKLKKSKR